MFTKHTKCLQNKCLQNKSLQTRYVYKAKYKTESIQNKTKVYKHVIFIKQKVIHKLCLQNKTKQKFTDKLCLQNTVYTHVMFTKQKHNKCLQNKSLQTRYVYKTKMYRQVMFTKQKKFTNTLCLQNKTESLQIRYVYKTRQNKFLLNKSLHTRYVYKTKYKTGSLQNKTKVYKHVMFTKQKFRTSYVYKTK